MIAAADIAKQLQPDDAACIGNYRRLNVRLRLVIEQALDGEWHVCVGIDCDLSALAIIKGNGKYFR